MQTLAAWAVVLGLVGGALSGLVSGWPDDSSSPESASAFSAFPSLAGVIFASCAMGVVVAILLHFSLWIGGAVGVAGFLVVAEFAALIARDAVPGGASALLLGVVPFCIYLAVCVEALWQVVRVTYDEENAIGAVVVVVMLSLIFGAAIFGGYYTTRSSPPQTSNSAAPTDERATP